MHNSIFYCFLFDFLRSLNILNELFFVTCPCSNHKYYYSVFRKNCILVLFHASATKNNRPVGWLFLLVRQMGPLCSQSDTPLAVFARKAGRSKRRHCGVFSAAKRGGRGFKPPLIRWQQKTTALLGGCFCWCGRWDLNPYARAHAPQTCLSANSSTAAHHVIIANGLSIVNSFSVKIEGRLFFF